ncbi:hypothetical protein [Luteibacter sp. UNCMF331Sha3.1]|uniref:hypothetical protein n=1 Tax=Luteibacter sp. UNCMF331Sha3.1 TaxID=1502760 RepID=UPI0014809700|nr:hypothetical protein [Luteibacter sp. UNCMF331Sha3.1]
MAAKPSQKEFADRLDANQSFVSVVEKGVVRMDALQIRDWCEAAGVSMEAWLKVFGALLEAREALRGDSRTQDRP